MNKLINVSGQGLLFPSVQIPMTLMIFCIVKFEKRVWPPVPSTETEKPMVPVRDLFVFIQFIFIVSNFMVMTVLSTIR